MFNPGVLLRRIAGWCLLLMAGLAATSASAATVRAYVQPDKARPNQVINYVITVSGGQVQSLPNLRFPLQIGQTSSVQTTQQIQIVNGQRTAALQLAWGIQASQPGEFVIPPQTIIVDGQPVTTNEVKLTVENGSEDFTAAAGEGPKIILQIELGKKEVYQGEVMPLNVSLYVPRQVVLRRAGLIEMVKSDFAIARFPQSNEQSETIIDGIGYYVLTFRSTLSSLRTGDLKVGPAKLELLVEVPMDDQRQRGRFPPGFGQNFPPGFFPGMSEPRKVELQSQQVTVKVLPLPAEGKPANFSGAVGDFQMTATASPTDLTVGDPVSVELAVSGAGNFDALTPPELVANGGWKLYPPKRYVIEGPMDQNQTPTLERKIGYTQVLVPEAVHPSVPPFEVNYFSPAQKQYVVLRTEAIPLTMKPAPLTAAGESSGGGTATTVTDVQLPPPVVDPQADITDILVHPPEKSRWLNPGGSMLLHSRLFWSVQVVPVGLFAFACLLAVARRRRAEQMAGRAGNLRAAWEEFERTGSRADSSEQDFLRAAAQFIQYVHGSAPVTGPVQAIKHRYETTNFAVARATSLQPAERKEIHSTLAALMRQHLARLSVILLAFLLTVSPALLAEEAPKAVAASSDDIYREAIAELDKGNFTRAQYLAESLTKKTPPQLSAEVFQIIGHARYRQKDMGRAALWYQRAQLLDGRNAELKQNLRHIFERTRYLVFGESSPLHEASIWLTMNEWLLLAAAGAWMILLALTWRVFRSSVWAIVIMVLGFIIVIPASAFAALRPLGADRVKNISIVTQPDVNSYTAATETSGSVISLPPGSQVRTLEKRGAWFYVEIPGSPELLRGWVEAGALTPLWPWDANMVP